MAKEVAIGSNINLNKSAPKACKITFFLSSSFILDSDNNLALVYQES